MAITFLEKRKRLQKLIPILLLVVLMTGLVIWKGFFTREAPPIIEEPLRKPTKKIEINFQALESTFLEKLESFKKIPPFGTTTGRENPFLPY